MLHIIFSFIVDGKKCMTVNILYWFKLGLNYTEMDNSAKNENSTIYSPSSPSKPVYVSF